MLPGHYQIGFSVFMTQVCVSSAIGLSIKFWRITNSNGDDMSRQETRKGPLVQRGLREGRLWNTSAMKGQKEQWEGDLSGKGNGRKREEGLWGGIINTKMFEKVTQKPTISEVIQKQPTISEASIYLLNIWINKICTSLNEFPLYRR